MKRVHFYTTPSTWGLGFDIDFHNRAGSIVVGPFNMDVDLSPREPADINTRLRSYLEGMGIPIIDVPLAEPDPADLRGVPDWSDLLREHIQDIQSFGQVEPFGQPGPGKTAHITFIDEAIIGDPFNPFDEDNC